MSSKHIKGSQNIDRLYAKYKQVIQKRKTVISLLSYFLTCELHAYAGVSCRSDVKNGTCSLTRLVDSCKLFSIPGFCMHLIVFWQVINKRNVDLCS